MNRVEAEQLLRRIQDDPDHNWMTQGIGSHSSPQDRYGENLAYVIVSYNGAEFEVNSPEEWEALRQRHRPR
jgi:hypothetical protein